MFYYRLHGDEYDDNKMYEYTGRHRQPATVNGGGLCGLFGMPSACVGILLTVALACCAKELDY